MKRAEKFDDLGWGFYVFGSYVSNTMEKGKDGKEAGYLLLNVGGRRGAFNIKYDVDNTELVSALAGLKTGAELVAKVRVNAFRDSTYYILDDVFTVSAADAVSKMMESVKGGAKL